MLQLIPVPVADTLQASSSTC